MKRLTPGFPFKVPPSSSRGLTLLIFSELSMIQQDSFVLHQWFWCYRQKEDKRSFLPQNLLAETQVFALPAGAPDEREQGGGGVQQAWSRLQNVPKKEKVVKPWGRPWSWRAAISHGNWLPRLLVAISAEPGWGAVQLWLFWTPLCRPHGFRQWPPTLSNNYRIQYG